MNKGMNKSMNDRTTQIYMVSGFLGAGKTSLMKHLIERLPDGHSVVVMVNEFGRLGLDGQMLERPGLSLYQLVNGCICCLLEEDLTRTMDEVLRRHAPKRILLEASGVADPAGLRQSLAEFGIGNRAAIAKVVTVLDARMWAKRRALGTLFMNQLRQADHILINKIDLLPPEQTETVARQITEEIPRAVVQTTVMGSIDEGDFWRYPATVTDKTEETTHETSVSTGFSSSHLQSDEPVDPARLEAFLRAAPSGLLRAKGQILLSDGSSRGFDWVDGQLDWHPPLDAVKETRIVVIGRGLESDALKEGLKRLNRMNQEISRPRF